MSPVVNNPHRPSPISTVSGMSILERFAGPAVGLALLTYFILRSGDPAVVLAALALVAVIVVPLLLLIRTATRFAGGPPAELAGATWSAKVTVGAGHGVPIGGLLAVWPDRVGFVPSDKATRKGLVPWQLSSEQLDGVEVKRGPAGAWITVYSQVSPAQVFACWRWQGCREAVAALGVAVR